MKKDSFSFIFLSLIFTILFLILGGGGIYYSIGKYVKYINLVSNGVKTDGIIQDYSVKWSYKKDKNNKNEE